MPLTNIRNWGNSVGTMFAGNNDQNNNQQSEQVRFTPFQGRGIVL